MSSRYLPYAFDINATQEFYGGESSDAAIGPPASFGSSQAMEFRRNPSQLTVLPGPRKISGGVVNDLILNMVQVPNGSRYALGNEGGFYKIDTNNVVTNIDKIPIGSDGLLYRADTDAIYMATQNDLRRYYPLSGTPKFDAIYGTSKSIDSAAYRTGGTFTCAVPTTISEGVYCSFLPDIEPFYSNKVNIATRGSGDWTLTLHDGLNNVLGTVTVPNAKLGGLTEFVYSAPIRALVKPNARTYHFHLTSTASGGSIACGVPDTMDTADFELWANRFVDPINNFHPMIQFEQFICIGNERYLSVWEPLTDNDPPNNEFQRHRLTFPPGFEVCGLATTDEFLVIACEKRSTNGTKDFQEGKLFIWDGIGETYNQVVDVADGSPEAICTYDNYPYFVVNGVLCAWSGGKSIIKVRAIADTSTEYTSTVDNTHAYPNMLSIRDNILHIGYPSNTNNISIKHGVYTWGSLEKNYPASFGYSYLISTQTNLNTAGTLQLGCVRSFGDEMYISWKDGNNYGLDIVDSLCMPAPTFSFRNRRFSAGAVYKDKQALFITIDSDPIPEGIIITPVHSIDREADIPHEEQLTVGKSLIKAAIDKKTFRTITYGFDGTCSGNISPIIYSTALQWNPLVDRNGL